MLMNHRSRNVLDGITIICQQVSWSCERCGSGRSEPLNPLLQAYAIGNPTSISPDTYNLDGVYKGFNLISEDLSQSLDSTNCPETSDYDTNVYDDEGNDFNGKLLDNNESLYSKDHCHTESIFRMRFKPSSFTLFCQLTSYWILRLTLDSGLALQHLLLYQVWTDL